ncbi:MAG: MotA/TolQ/ExbB proton channel family protein [Verrucomicrobia bacterium]|nr:MotA/TolQ/ExbB proton channel family protein [Verrucomicrobiota bacterium]
MNEQSLFALERGGPVLWVLFLVSIFGFMVFVERVLFLHRMQVRTQDFLAGIKNLVRKRRLVEALTVCEETPGPVAAITKAALLQYQEDSEAIRLAIQSAALVEIPILERRVASLAAIARIAPMLGLLGTVVAIVGAFSLAGNTPQLAYPNPAEALAGLAQALISTGLGIALAIMATVGHHFVAGRIKVLVGDMEYSGHDILQFLILDVPEIEATEQETES